MKYIKTYESETKKFDYKTYEPKIGDYIICKERDIKKEISDFISTNIGRILTVGQGIYDLVVQYENVPDDLTPYFSYNRAEGRNSRGIDINEIIFLSPDKSKAEVFLDSKKYNL